MCKPPIIAAEQPPSVLYSCRPNHAPPDWSQYDDCEVLPIKIYQHEGREIHENMEGHSKSEIVRDVSYWCVFGHLREGGIDSITDTLRYVDAVRIADHFIRTFIHK